MEIIEVGAVAVNSTDGQIESEFQSFVRPVRNPILTDFCRELTSISQVDVDAADDYPTTMQPFREWLSTLGHYDFCSWGYYDRKQFEQDSQFHSVAYPFTGEHRNIKIEFSEAIGSRKKMGVGGALKHLGFEFEAVSYTHLTLPTIYSV